MIALVPNVIKYLRVLQDVVVVFRTQCLCPLVMLIVASSVCSFPGPEGWAQETIPETNGNEENPDAAVAGDDQQEEQSDQPIPLEEVPNRAETTSAELRVILPRGISRKTPDQVRSDTASMVMEVKSRLARTRKSLAGRPNIRALQKSEFDLSAMLKLLRSIEEEQDTQLSALRTSVGRIERISEVWKATDELAKSQVGADKTTLVRIAAVRNEIENVQLDVVQQRNELLAIRDELVNPSIELGDTVIKLQVAIDARFKGILQADHPPLWSPLVRESFLEEIQIVEPRQFLIAFDENGNQNVDRVQMLPFQLVLFIVIALVLRWLRDRTRSRADDDERRHAQLVFEHPWAMAVLITFVLTVPLHPMAPRSVGIIGAAFIAVATLRIVRRFLPPAMALLAWGLAILFFFDRARDMLAVTPTLERFVFLGEMIGGLALMLWLLRPSRIASLPEERRQHPFVKLLYTAMRVGGVAVAISIVADLVGRSDLAVLLGDGVLRSGYLGFLVFVLLKVFHGLATFALVLRPFRLLRVLSNHRQFVEHKLKQVLSILAVCFWGVLVCGRIGLLTPATDLVNEVLGASIAVGTLSISVADVLVFAFTIGLSFVLARLVQTILQEDVFTRVRTGRGVPYAVSNLARYSVIFLGFLVGLSAAGVEMSKLAVIAGGLGVGIGFGLQNVVNNFVSGLILLFERPIDVGDSIEFSGTTGTMLRIGIRASLIRTFDGAEVIVPNGLLISEKVTNWTLSDRRRRVELVVGVEYGTPAEHVIELLVSVAKANPKVISNPQPEACFEAFGESSLDFRLRAWYEATVSTTIHSIRSELAVAVQKVLDDEGIGVPFPQRDLRLISVPDNAASASGAAQPNSAPEDRS